MREILFKAKRIDNGEWIEGSLITGVFFRLGQGIPYIFCPDEADYDCFEDFSEENGIFEVDPATICQYTGLTDKNSNKIWENDIVQCVSKEVVISGGPYSTGYRFGDKLKVKCLKSGFTLSTLTNNSEVPNVCGNVKNYEFWNIQRFLKVIGNIFDNPELLKESE